MTDQTDDLKQSIDQLRRVEEQHLVTRQWWYGLIHGLMVGIGGTVGVAIVLTVVIAILNRFAAIPGAAETRDLIQRSVTR
jgi:hypothetical protein